MGRRFCILGTAGHIDHGKSALVTALTGTDPDRLPEEKSRGMTIELGFAHLALTAAETGGEEIHVGIVDVPGHERFVRTMVAGATGIDIGLLVVAADDGVMPQTREHVEILDLLGVRHGVVAITKSDVVASERVDAVRLDISDLVDGTLLKDWPIAVTSAKTGEGLEALRALVGGLIADLPQRTESSIFRVAIDRVFGVHGRGTVVTGSVLSGSVSPSTALELHPAALACKVRELQSHGREVGDAHDGQRVALNLTGIDRDRIERGMELATPGYLTKCRYLDATVRMLPRLEKPLPSHRRVRVSMATSEAMAMLVVVGGDEIDPGESALAQLRFLRPVVASFGQRFILRSETAQRTIGGGEIVRPVSRRLRPKHPDELVQLRQAASGDAFERYSEAVRRAGFDAWSDERMACEIGIEPQLVAEHRDRLAREGKLARIGSHRIHRSTLTAIVNRALAFLKRHHANNPAEPGISKDRFVGWIGGRAAAGFGRHLFDHLNAESLIRVNGPYVAHHEFHPALSEEDAAAVEQLVDEIRAAGFDPPEWGKLRAIQSLSKQRNKVLSDLARVEPSLVSFAPQKYISVEALDRFKETIRSLGNGGRKFKLAQVRDGLGLSRRVVQPLLEHLDRVSYTKRIGDERVIVGE